MKSIGSSNKKRLVMQSGFIKEESMIVERKMQSPVEKFQDKRNKSKPLRAPPNRPSLTMKLETGLAGNSD